MEKEGHPYVELAKRLSGNKSTVFYIASSLHQLSLMAKKQGYKPDVNIFIDAFLQAMDLDQQSLIFPSFTDQLSHGDHFDSKKTKPTIGALPIRVFRRKDFVRTLDPLHSVLIKGHLEHDLDYVESSFGKGSAFDLLHHQDACQYFIDVSLQDSFTFVHYIEECLKVNYRRYYKQKFWVNGEEKWHWFHTRKPGFFTDLAALEKIMIEEGVLSSIDFYGVKILQLQSVKAFNFVAKLIEQDGGKILRSFTWKEWLRRQGKRYIKGKKI